MENPATQLIQTCQNGEPYKRNERNGLFCLGMLLFGMLAAAAWLKPNPEGLGTHTQLGLPGCTMYTFIGMRCPGCGMTTSWAHTMNGDLTSALRANVGGVLLCFLAAAVFPCVMWMAIRGRAIKGRWFSQVSIGVLLIAIGISVIEWTIRLAV